MLDYLMKYGINRYENEYNDVDINDRLMLQDQINNVRQNYWKLLALLDQVQTRLDSLNFELSKKTKELVEKSVEQNERLNTLLQTDEEWISMDSESQALKTGLSMINNQLEFCKSDLRILNSVFYNKF